MLVLVLVLVAVVIVVVVVVVDSISSSSSSSSSSRCSGGRVRRVFSVGTRVRVPICTRASVSFVVVFM